MTQKSSRALLWRGALGGLVGCFLWIFVMPLFHNWPALKSYYLALALFYGMLLTTITGTIIGAVIWFIHEKTKKNIGIILRALIGTMIAIVAGLIYMGVANERMQIFYLVEFGVVIGAVAGMIAGRQSSTKPNL